MRQLLKSNLIFDLRGHSSLGRPRMGWVRFRDCPEPHGHRDGVRLARQLAAAVAHSKDLMTDNEATPAWMASAQRLAAYVADHGALPRQSGADSDEERRAGIALKLFRSRLYATSSKGPLSAEQLRWLDTYVPAWRGENTRVKARGRRIRTDFTRRTTQIQRFVTTHERMPSIAGRGAHERQLGRFLINMRQSAEGRGTHAWDETRRAVLDRKVPGWDRKGHARSRPMLVIGSLPLSAAI